MFLRFESALDIDHRLTAADYQITIRTEHSGNPVEEVASILFVKINRDITTEYNVKKTEAIKGLHKISSRKLHHSSDIVTDLPLVVFANKIFVQYLA